MIRTPRDLSEIREKGPETLLSGEGYEHCNVFQAGVRRWDTPPPPLEDEVRKTVSHFQRRTSCHKNDTDPRAVEFGFAEGATEEYTSEGTGAPVTTTRHRAAHRDNQSIKPSRRDTLCHPQSTPQIQVFKHSRRKKSFEIRE